MNLIVINNLQTYFSLLNYNLNDKVILTTDIELCYQLQKKGKRFINLWRYLTDDIITETELKVQKISESFQTPFSKDFDYFGVSVFHISKIFLRYFYKACYHTFDTLKKLTSENNIHQVYINKANPVSLNVANYSETSILDSMSEYFYRLKNIEIKHFITSNQTIKSTRNINKGIKYSEFISDSLEDIVSRNINKKILYILSDNFEWDFDLIRYIKKKKNLDIYVVWRTPEIIKEEHNHYEWLPLFFSDFEFEDSKLINLYKEIDKSEQYFFNEFRKTNSEYVEIFNNKYLDFQFRDYYKRLKNYVKDLSTFDRIYDFIKPDIVHFSNTWDMSVRCMIKRAMDLGCETYGTIHGGIVDNAGYLTRKFEIDNYLVWGSDNFEGLVKAGQNPESVKIVGSMQMESWNNKIKNFNKSLNVENDSEYSKYFNFDSSNIKKDSRFTITFYTSAGGGFSGHTFNEFKHFESLTKIIELAKNHPDFKFNIKPHILFDYPDFWKSLKTDIPDNFEILKSKDLLKSCLESDLNVLLNTMSNVAFEISLTVKPVIYLKDAVFNFECAESTLERGGLLCHKSVSEFEKYLEEFVNNKDAREELEIRRQKFLKYALSDFDKPVAERINELYMKKPGNNLNKGNFNLYETIDWVRKFIKTGTLKKFPDLDNKYAFPDSKSLTLWLYTLTENWCNYFGKSDFTSKYYSRLLNKIPSGFGISGKEKIRRKIYSNSRNFYLKHHLNENRVSRFLIDKSRKIKKSDN